jgi:amino acid transporter
MARDRRLPGSLAAVSASHGTPTGAIALLIVLQLVLIAAAEFWDALFALPGLDHYFALFAWCATFGGFALLVVYLLMSIGALVKLGQEPKPVGVAIAAIVGVAITGAAIWGSFYKVPSPTIWAPRYAVIWFAIGLIYMALVKGREPASQALADLTEGS